MSSPSRRLQRLFYLLISALVIVALPARASEPGRTLVADTLYRADGTTARGTILISWPAFSSADGKPVAAGSLSVKIGPNGSVNIPLVPTQSATPAGTAYKVVIALDDGATSTEYWAVPALSPTTIAAVRSTQVPVTVAMQVVSREYVDGQLASAVRKNGDETINGSKTFATSPLVPPPGTDAAAANKGYVDVAIAAAAPSPANVLNINKGGTGTNSFTPARCVRVASDGNSLEAASSDCGNSNADTVDGVHAADLTSATKIQGTPVVAAGPQAAGQQLNFDGAQYSPQAKEHTDVRDLGMQPSVAGNLIDNSPRLAALMNAVSSGGWSGGRVVFPPVAGSAAYYYFAGGLRISRPTLLIDCGTSGRSGGVNIVVPAGIDGISIEETTTSVDGFTGAATTLRGCGVYSLGAGVASTAQGSATVTGLSLYSQGPIAAAPFASGDGIIIVKSYTATWNKANKTWDNLTVPPGAWLDSVTGSMGVLHSGFAATLSGANQMALRLPAALACTGTYSSGSHTVTNINCPFKFKPGSMVWSDAFPLKTWASVVSGAQGNQTATFTATGTAENCTIDACASYSGTGKFWVIPAGFHLYVTARLDENYAYGFGAGEAALCSSGGGLNCTTLTQVANNFERNLWGRFLSGNNSGGGQFIGTIFAHNFLNDALDDGTIGNIYSGESYNSSESDSVNAAQGNCGNQNWSSYNGVYYGGLTGWTFRDRDGGSCPSFVQPVYNVPSDVSFSQGQYTNVSKIQGPDPLTPATLDLYNMGGPAENRNGAGWRILDHLNLPWYTFQCVLANPGSCSLSRNGTEVWAPLQITEPGDAAAIGYIQRAGNSMTVALGANAFVRGLWAGESIQIAGVAGDATLNGFCTVTTVGSESVPFLGSRRSNFTCTKTGADSGPFTNDGMLYTAGGASGDVTLRALAHPANGAGTVSLDGGNSSNGKVRLNFDSGQGGTEFGDGAGHVVAKIDSAGALTATKIQGISDASVVANLDADMVDGKHAIQLTDSQSFKGAVLDASVSSPSPGKVIGALPAAPGSYANAGGQGERSASVAVSASAATLTGSLPLFVNGAIDSGLYFTGGSAAGKWVQFDFGLPKIVTEAKYLSQGGAQGTWKWQGSADGAAWTDVGASFVLDGDSSASFTMAQLSANVTAYRYYRLLGISGNTNSSPWVHEMQFKIGDAATWGAVVDGWVSAPATATDACTPGMRAYDASFIYVCVAANAWKRSALSSW